MVTMHASGGNTFSRGRWRGCAAQVPIDQGTAMDWNAAELIEFLAALIKEAGKNRSNSLCRLDA
jgi:hypothetical protein